MNPNTSTVILGASSPQQVLDNLEAVKVLPKLTPEVMDKIEKILGNKPKPEVGRVPLAWRCQLTDVQKVVGRGKLDGFAKL